MRIRRLDAADADQVLSAAELFDHRPDGAATARFLTSPDHHLLLAEDDDGRPVGFVSGVETTHPDKGTEMFLYELGVAEDARNQGVGRGLVAALRDLARDRGCYGMWVLTDEGNQAALRTYGSAGGSRTQTSAMLEWDFGRPDGVGHAGPRGS